MVERARIGEDMERIHTANSSAWQKMKLAVDAIAELYEQQQGE